ncbi:MAG: hypothetical protein JNL80_13835 [Phycisphaerae bacterium]|jgi:hypothetical protein|nr:hypothetical protein [Phycisphaerae bacterium]
MSRITLAVASAATLLVSSLASAQSYSTTGPSSSATPYVLAMPGSDVVTDVISILTVGDNIDGYILAGLPDGMGALPFDAGSSDLFVNYEMVATAGGVHHAFQPRGVVGGAYISRWNLSTQPGPDFLRVNSGAEAILVANTLSNGGGTLFQFGRFCSADIAAQSAYFNSATGKGTLARIYTVGEETGSNGRMTATDLGTGELYQLPAFDPLLGGWENGVARPFESDDTVVIGLSDGGANRVFLYVGTKQDTGNSIERAGLMNGTGYGIVVQVDGVNVAAETRDFCFGSGTPVFSGTFTFAPGATAAGTSFLRPEDGAWDPANPNDFYFVCTDRMSTTSGGAPQSHASRLFRLRFSDANNVLAGGTIEALLDGTDVMEMGDNLCVFNDLQGGTRVIIQEDTGNHPHSAKTLLYTVANDSLEVILKSDSARFGDIGVPATAPFTQDEENSGVIDARETLGLGWFFGNTQGHYPLPNPLVEGGQLYAFFAPEAVGSSRSDLSTPLDGAVNGADLAILLGGWAGSGRTDINRDGTTDAADLAILLGAWTN